MEPGRYTLKYFSESDLEPTGSLKSVNEIRHSPVLNMREIGDIRAFSIEFSNTGEYVLTGSRADRKPHLRTFIAILLSLGAVKIAGTSSGTRVSASGKLARHLPEILSIYLGESHALIENWNSRHLIPEDSLSALEVVSQLELRRIDQQRRSGIRPQALADRPVAFAVFHARDRHGRDCYLFELNKDWRRLNFIGGKQEPVDGGDFGETMLRETSEELGISRDRITLTRLNQQPIPAYSISGNVGSLASYPCVLYGVTIDGDINERVQDCWLTEDAVRKASTSRNSPLMVNPAYLAYLLEGNPTRMSRTPISTNTVVRSVDFESIYPAHESRRERWIRVMRENKDLLTALLTLGAAAITLAVTLTTKL